MAELDEVIGAGDRRFVLEFYHANYPEGVRDKRYELRTIARSERFIVATTGEFDGRFLHIHEIGAKWIETHFPHLRVGEADVQRWLDRNV